MADLHQNEHRSASAIQNNQLPHHLLDSSSSQDVFHRRFERLPPPISSLHQVNSETQMFHQRVLQPQPHSASRSIEESGLFNSDRSFRVIEENDNVISNEFEADFGAESGFLLENSDNPNCDDVANSGFMVDDFGDDFFVPSSRRNRHGARSVSGDSSDAGENEAVDEDCDQEASFHLCWDAFHLEDEITSVNPNPNQDSNSNSNANEDFEWEEVDDRIDERETLSMFFGAEPDDDDASVSPVILTGFEEPSEEHDALQWQVLSNVHNFEPNLDSEDQYDEYNYTEYEMFFGQFADSDVVSSLGRPPASKTAVVNLSTVVMTEEDVVNNNTLCAVCKDEVVVGEMATQLPCSHRYHGDCILPWLAVRNTCPVCRHELPTDDPDYERRRAERG